MKGFYFLLLLPVFFRCSDPTPQAKRQLNNIDSSKSTHVKTSDSSKANSPGNYIAPITNSLTPIETINFCDDYEKNRSNNFGLPISGGNFRLIFKKVRFDSASFNEIRRANLFTINTACNKVNDPETDSDAFNNDFDTSAANHTFYFCRGSTNNKQGNPIQFYMIGPEEGKRYYLVTFKLLNQQRNFIKLVDAALVTNVYRNSGQWGYERTCNLFDSEKIEMHEDCWSYPEWGKIGLVYNTVTTLSIDGESRMKINRIQSNRVYDR